MRPGRAPDETILQSIFLYDEATGGNGYVAALRDQVASALHKSIHILDCGKKCDAACHGCLLTFDTQYDSAKLNRHEARAFLTDERLAGLDLDESARLLGPDSQMLTRPLCRHLAEVAGELGVGEIRLSVGGAPDTWDVEVFPLYREILRWADDHRLVRLLIAPETWIGLDDGVRHSLAALVTAGQGWVEVHRAAATTCCSKNSVVIAAVGGEQGSVRWASSSEIAPPMSDVWGQSPENGQLVYARAGDPLPKIKPLAVAVDQLRPQPDGTVAIVEIRKELDGRLEGFGSRFWSAVKDHCSPIKDRFETGGLLKEVSYSDRYITTPWAFLVIREVLLALVRDERADSGTAFRLFTRKLGHRKVSPLCDRQWITDPWQHEDARKSFFKKAFEEGRGQLRWTGMLSLKAGTAPHFRELRLDWADGVAWTLKLDQGVSYWRCKPSAPFPFDGTLHEQMQSFNQAAKQCRAVSHGIHPTYIYVAKE